MSLVVNVSASQWDFSTPDNLSLSMADAGWHVREEKSGIWTEKTNATVSLVFQGSGIYLYSTRSPQGGKMKISCDWDWDTVSLDAPKEQEWQMWSKTGMDPTVQHAIRIQMLGGEGINIDHVGIEPGDFSPFPPTVPSPIPPTFPARFVSVSMITSASAMTVTTTTTMKMTMTAPPGPSSDISLSKGAVAGIAVGLIAISFSAAFLFIWCWQNRNRRNGYTVPGSPYSGIRRLSLPRWVRVRDISDPRSSGPSFTQIDDRDRIEEEMVAKNNVGVSNRPRVSAFLPSISRQSTLSMGPSAMLSVSTPRLSMLAQPPEPSYISQSQGHKLNRSLAKTLSINTDVNSIRRGGVAGPSSQSQVIRSVQSHRHDTSDGFSTSDFASEWEAINFNGDYERNIDDADFYTEHFSSDHIHSEEQPVERMDDPDDMSPDTPLIAHSPAMASSNVSLSHRSSSTSRTSRFSRGNKILRSAHSRRSSLRRSLGRLSQRSSRMPNARVRTPISKNSTSTTSTETPVSDGRYSTLSAFGTSILGEDISEIPESPPPVPRVPSAVQASPPSHPPSAWTETSTSSASISPNNLRRLHKPAGPRARSSSISSIIGKSSSGGSVHSRTSSRNERRDMLSVVEEASRSGSARSSSVENRPSRDGSEGMGLLHV